MKKDRFYTENIGAIKENEFASFKKAVELCGKNSGID